MDLNRYLELWILSMARTVSRYYLKDARGRRFITALIPALGKSAGVRKTYALRGIHIPPFLIASITSQCNLQCTGCYARAKECAGTALSEDMTTSEWRRIFQEAADIGVSFILLAGGEPLMRRDVLSLAALEEFQSRGLLYGVSLTVTAENFREVTSDSFVADLRKAGCGIVMYLAYVPAVRGAG